MSFHPSDTIISKLKVFSKIQHQKKMQKKTCPISSAVSKSAISKANLTKLSESKPLAPWVSKSRAQHDHDHHSHRNHESYPEKEMCDWTEISILFHRFWQTFDLCSYKYFISCLIIFHESIHKSVHQSAIYNNEWINLYRQDIPCIYTLYLIIFAPIQMSILSIRIPK